MLAPSQVEPISQLRLFSDVADGLHADPRTHGMLTDNFARLADRTGNVYGTSKRGEPQLGVEDVVALLNRQVVDGRVEDSAPAPD
jgi:hypothetical protein